MSNHTGLTILPLMNAWRVIGSRREHHFPLPETVKDRIIAMFAVYHGANIKSRFILFTSQKVTSAIFIFCCSVF